MAEEKVSVSKWGVYLQHRDNDVIVPILMGVDEGGTVQSSAAITSPSQEELESLHDGDTVTTDEKTYLLVGDRVDVGEKASE